MSFKFDNFIDLIYGKTSTYEFKQFLLEFLSFES